MNGDGNVGWLGWWHVVTVGLAVWRWLAANTGGTMFWRWRLKLLLDNFINSYRSQDQHHAYQWFIVYVFIFVDTSFIHRLAAPLKETNMFRDSICSSECQKKCSISDRQSADTPPDSSNSAVESVRKIVKSALQMKWQSFNMPFGLSLILHPANSFKKGKVPIVKQMLPVMVRSVYATKYSVEHLRHFKHKTIAQFLLETTISVRKSGISWRKYHSFYTRGIPLKDRRSIRILRAHETLHGNRNCILSRASAAWSTSNGPSRRPTRVDTVMLHPGHGRFTKTDLPRKTVALQWRYKSFCH